MKAKKVLAIFACAALLVAATVGATLAYLTDKTEEVKNTFTVGKVAIDLTETSEAVDGDDTVVVGEGNNSKGFDYTNMIPGFTYAKKPVVTVDEKSMDCYVFLEMDMTQYVSLLNLMMLNENAAAEGKDGAKVYASTTEFVKALAADKDLFQSVMDKWFVGVEHEDWQIMNLDELTAAFETWTTPGSNPVELPIVFGHLDDDNIMEAEETATFMTGFTIPGTVTSEMLEKKESKDSNIDGMNMTFKAYAIQADGIDDLEAAYGELFPNGTLE